MKRLYVVGIGPGAVDKMTYEAHAALDECMVIAGYKTYIKLIEKHFPDKEYIVNGMREEVKRCELALEAANSGKIWQYVYIILPATQEEITLRGLAR